MVKHLTIIHLVSDWNSETLILVLLYLLHLTLQSQIRGKENARELPSTSDPSGLMIWIDKKITKSCSCQGILLLCGERKRKQRLRSG